MAFVGDNEIFNSLCPLNCARSYFAIYYISINEEKVVLSFSPIFISPCLSDLNIQLWDQGLATLQVPINTKCVIVTKSFHSFLTLEPILLVYNLVISNTNGSIFVNRDGNLDENQGDFDTTTFHNNGYVVTPDKNYTIPIGEIDQLDANSIIYFEIII